MKLYSLPKVYSKWKTLKSNLLRTAGICELVFIPLSVTTFLNKMADELSEAKQVLLATEAELYIEQLKVFPLREIGSPK